MSVWLCLPETAGWGLGLSARRLGIPSPQQISRLYVGLKMDLQQAVHHPNVTLVQGVISGAGNGFSVSPRSFLTARATKKKKKPPILCFTAVFFLIFKKLIFNWRMIVLQHRAGLRGPSA